jgi:hypothetical protein
MASILIGATNSISRRRALFIKPTDSHFAPDANDPYSGTIRIGQVGNVVSVGERSDSVQLKRMMMQLWTKCVTANSNLFPNRVHGQAHQRIPCASDGPARLGSSVGRAAARDPSDQCESLADVPQNRWAVRRSHSGGFQPETR